MDSVDQIPETVPPDAEQGDDVFTVVAAQVTGAHGVTGNVRLRLIGTNPDVAAESLQAGRQVCARAEHGEARLLTLRSLRRQAAPKGAWIGQFREVTSRTEAETLLGCSLFVREAQRATLPEGEYYVDHLRGAGVVTDTGHSLGLLTDVLHTPANDVYVTDQDVLIPAVPEFILDIDLEAKRITVRDVPGLREGT